MLEWLTQLDLDLFRFINSGLANPVTDMLMPIVTSETLLRVLYGIAVVLLVWRGDARLRWLALFSVLLIVASDQLNSGFLKSYFGRLRPCNALDNVHLLVSCGGGKSFPSSHAANSFAQATFFSLFAPRLKWALLGFATLVSLSRVFVGVHYPADLIVGAVVGMSVGGAIFILFDRLKPHENWYPRRANRATPHK